MRRAFGDSVAVIWTVLTALLGVGALASVAMRDVPLHDYTDEKWALKDAVQEKPVDA